MEFADFGVSPKDAEMLAGRQFTSDEVASLYGLEHCPPEDEEERKQFIADVLAPITAQLASQLDFSILLNEYGEKDYYFEFDLNEKLARRPREPLPGDDRGGGTPVAHRRRDQGAREHAADRRWRRADDPAQRVALGRRARAGATGTERDADSRPQRAADGRLASRERAHQRTPKDAADPPTRGDGRTAQPARRRSSRRSWSAPTPARSRRSSPRLSYLPAG